jgi:hypothetical protein
MMKSAPPRASGGEGCCVNDNAVTLCVIFARLVWAVPKSEAVSYIFEKTIGLI